MAKDKIVSVSLKSSVKRRVLWLVLYVLPVLGLIAFGGFYFKKYNDLKNHPVSAEQATANEETRVLKEVGKLYDLPKDEKPTIATVKDKEALKKQYPGFFDKAENDDKLLIYQNAKLAILYRPSTKQLIKVGPLSVQSNPVVKVIGAEADRANIEKQLKDAKLNVTDSGSPKGSPSGITVVDVTGQNSDLVKNIATLVHGQVGNVPAGEEKPDGVQILVFVGPTQ